MKPVDTLQSLVMCHFSTTAPATNALNRSATARAIDGAGAAKKAARVYNTVISARGTAVGKAISLQQRTGVAIRKLGLPIRLGGIYLPVKRITEAHNMFDDALVEMDTIREDILASYPAILKEVRTQLGTFASEVVIPSASEVAARFTMNLTILNQPVPVGDLKGVVKEVANRVRAESRQQAHDLLREAHAGPVEDLKRQLAEFTDALRNAQRLHFSQFDKLRDEVKRVRELNVLDLPEVEEVIRLASIAAVTPAGELSTDERAVIARQAERASEKADETLAALGL